MTVLLIALIVYAAILTQAVSGWGLALVSMPLLVQIMPPVQAAALVALIGLSTQLIMLSRYRQAVNLRALWRLMVGSVCGIPVGVYVLASLDKHVILTILGILLIGYALYSLATPHLPEIKNQRWGFVFGFASGILGGAYNTGGPPFVIYGMGRRWLPAEFKGNLQTLLMVNSSTVIITHIAAHHYTPVVLQNYLIALPMIVAGALTGFWLDKHINAAVFRKVVLISLLVIGTRLLLP